MRASTVDPVEADRLQAEAGDARAPARRHEQPVAAQLGAVGELQHELVALAPRGGGVAAEVQLDAVGGERLGDRLAERRRARGRAARSAPSTIATEAPIRTSAWPSSSPTGPPPSTSSRRGTSVSPVASRLVHTPSRPCRPGTGGTTASEPVASTTWRAV